MSDLYILDMLRACILDFKRSWKDQLYMVFSDNNSFQDNIKMEPLKILYGQDYRLPLYWDEVGERGILGPELVTQYINQVNSIKEHMRTTQDRLKNGRLLLESIEIQSWGLRVYQDITNERCNQIWQEG